MAPPYGRRTLTPLRRAVVVLRYLIGSLTAGPSSSTEPSTAIARLLGPTTPGCR